MRRMMTRLMRSGIMQKMPTRMKPMLCTTRWHELVLSATGEQSG